MSSPILYVSFPGTTREALEFSADVFGGDLQFNTYAEFARTNGPGDAIAHGVLSGRPVSESGVVIDPLTSKPWGASDGQVVDRYGLRWLIGYEPEA